MISFFLFCLTVGSELKMARDDVWNVVHIEAKLGGKRSCNCFNFFFLRERGYDCYMENE